MSTARRPKSWLLCALVLTAASAGCAKGMEMMTGAAGSGGGGPAGTTGTAGSGGAPDMWARFAAKALHVQGNKIVDTTGATFRMLGVNRAGSEYMCSPPTTGSYVFDGSTGPSTINGMKDWHINTVRLPMNESCWLGINGALVTAQHYRDEIIDYVFRLHLAGIYVVLDLHWSAPGTTVITGGANGNQLVTMAFADHALDFWTSVATTFKDDPMMIFDLFNEPILVANDRFGNGPVSNPWGCWRNGCQVAKGAVAGMQQMLDRVRATGAQQLVVAGGVDWAHQLDGWLANKPTDSTGNLLAGFHVYQQGLSDCYTQDCWEREVTPVAAQVPVLVGEMGEQDCAHGYIDQFMAWADGKGLSYLGWAWNPQNCNNFPALVTDFNGTPTNFGIGLRDHLIQINP